MNAPIKATPEQLAQVRADNPNADILVTHPDGMRWIHEPKREPRCLGPTTYAPRYAER
jgi:hypothetical protein